MKKSEIVEMSTQDLLDRLDEVSVALTKMKMDHVITPLENPMKIRYTRREIARIKTELGRRQREERDSEN